MTETEQELRRPLTGAAQAVDAPDRWDEVVAEAERPGDATVSPFRRHRSIIVVAGIAASILVGVVLASGDDPAEVTTDLVDDSAVPSTTTSTSPSTTVSTTTTTEAPPTTTTTEPPSEPALPQFPAASDNLVHGGDIWAVVLAVGSDPQGPEVLKAVDAAAAAGYFAGPTDCDQGAPEAMGVDGNPPGVYSVSVYFDTEADARAAVDAFEARSVPAVAAVVQTFCLD